ncbi:MAG: endolytic transglycosylase MltG [Spirochaetales bacterium]|nr:endolytic transglycosylase MltG [Spirochaetales bacterium]
MKYASMTLRAIVLPALLALMFTVLLLVLPPARQEPVLVRIERGSTLSQIALQLRDQRVITSTNVFRLILKIGGRDRTIKAGTYSFPAGISTLQAANMISKGQTIARKVLIPEGRTMRQIADILASEGITRAEDFLAAAKDEFAAREAGIPYGNFEGYLFPDTYLLEADANARDIVGIMTRRFFEVTASFGKSVSPEALHRAVIIASIVEREYRKADEAPLIASVFYNRLASGMPLQSCATVAYVLTEHQGKPHPSQLFYSDLQIDDPYNTYRHRGLPPGPISNPGEVALRAALFPAETDFLYFRLLDDGNGAHRFSRTFEEHTGASIRTKGL